VARMNRELAARAADPAAQVSRQTCAGVMGSGAAADVEIEVFGSAIPPTGRVSPAAVVLSFRSMPSSVRKGGAGRATRRCIVLLISVYGEALGPALRPLRLCNGDRQHAVLDARFDLVLIDFGGNRM
jgi:hypothetical protein